MIIGRFTSDGQAVMLLVIVAADESVTELGVYTGQVIWHGKRLHVLVDTADSQPLIGTGLLYGSRLTVDAIENGPVTIAPLP